jgi:hypothetical protein
MTTNEGAPAKWASWAGPVTLLAVDGAAGLWMWQTRGTFVPLWSAVVLLATAAVLGAAWLYRVRASRRLSAALNAYAEQELARARRRLHARPAVGGHATGRNDV